MDDIEKKIKNFFFSEMFFYMLIFILSVSIFKVLNTHNIPNNEFSIKTTISVLKFSPDWIAFQNRLMGPYLILFISKLGLSFETAWKLFLAFFIFLQNLTLVLILKRERYKNSEIIIILSIFSLIFLTIQHFCLYPWDNIDLFFFTLFSYWILKEKKIIYFLILFSLSIFNRETALFIPIYLILSSLIIKDKIPYFGFRSYKFFLGGFITFILGIMYVILIRDYLFIADESTHLDNFSLIGNRIHFFENLKYILYKNFFGTNLIYSFFIISTVIFFFIFRVKKNQNYLYCYLIFLLISINIIFFGYFNETRMLMILLPFVLFLGLEVKRSL